MQKMTLILKVQLHQSWMLIHKGKKKGNTFSHAIRMGTN